MIAHLSSERYKVDSAFREACACKIALGLGGPAEEAPRVTGGGTSYAVRIPIDGEDHPTTQALRQEQATDAKRAAGELASEIEAMPADVRKAVGLE
jgi:hypothetical protein